MWLRALDFVLACAPAALLLAYLARERKGDLQGQLKLAGLCAGGIVALLPAALAAGWLERAGPATDLWKSFAVAALPEEAGKWIAILAATRLLALDRVSTLEAGLCVSAGFAVFENFMYVGADPVVFAARSLSAAPLHAACGFLIAASASSPRQRGPRGAAGAVAAMTLHGGYDLAIFSGLIGAMVASVLARGGLALCVRALGRERRKARPSLGPSPSP